MRQVAGHESGAAGHEASARGRVPCGSTAASGLPAQPWEVQYHAGDVIQAAPQQAQLGGAWWQPRSIKIAIQLAATHEDVQAGVAVWSENWAAASWRRPLDKFQACSAVKPQRPQRRQHGPAMEGQDAAAGPVQLQVPQHRKLWNASQKLARERKLLKVGMLRTLPRDI